MSSDPQILAPDEVNPGLRGCPSVPGDKRPLIVHSIDTGICSKRQQNGFHRCHRCLYRGKPLDWIYEEPQPFETATPVVGTRPTD